MLERDLAQNRIGCIGCIHYRGRPRYDTPAKSEIHHSLLQARVEPRERKKIRAYLSLGRNRISRIGLYRIGAPLPIRAGTTVSMVSFVTIENSDMRTKRSMRVHASPCFAALPAQTAPSRGGSHIGRPVRNQRRGMALARAARRPACQPERRGG